MTKGYIRKIINVKVLFCSIVSFASVLVSCLVLLITGYLNFVYFLITFVIGFMFSLVQIAYATRKDMKNPSFPKNDQEEVTEGNSNMSTLILTGLMTTIIAGGGSVLLSIVIGMKYNERVASYISIGFVFLITLIAFIAATVYLFKGLKKDYYVSIDGDDKFQKGDTFDKDAVVKVYYHSFKEDKKDTKK